MVSMLSAAALCSSDSARRSSMYHHQNKSNLNLPTKKEFSFLICDFFRGQGLNSTNKFSFFKINNSSTEIFDILKEILALNPQEF